MVEMAVASIADGEVRLRLAEPDAVVIGRLALSRSGPVVDGAIVTTGRVCLIAIGVRVAAGRRHCLIGPVFVRHGIDVLFLAIGLGLLVGMHPLAAIARQWPPVSIVVAAAAAAAVGLP